MALHGTTGSKENVSDRGALAIEYFDELKRTLGSISVSNDSGESIPLDLALGTLVAEFESVALAPGKAKLVFIGNGGSSAIASHGATDYMKNGGFRTYSFTDATLITCLANDFGYEHAYEKAVAGLMLEGDILLVISSSGRSPNVLNAANAAIELGASVVTCTGFDPDNPIRTKGSTNFHVSSHNYPVVEASHMAVLDSILQASIRTRRTC